MTALSANANPLPLLFIGIPTFNRAPYLRDLLTALETQLLESRAVASDVRILVSDNSSSDETPSVIAQFSARIPCLESIRQRQNIGAGRNIVACARAAVSRGAFCWICGDDELLQPGGLKSLLDLLRSQPTLSLVVNLRPGYPCALARPAGYASYRDYAAACARVQPHILVEHTLVSSNVFRADLFDPALGEAKVSTSFPHMYALLDPMIDRGRSVFLPAFPLIEIRERRPPLAEFPVDMEQSWRDFLRWQKDKLQLAELDPEQAIEYVRKDLLRRLSRHPIRFVRNNLQAVLKPAAWWFMGKRLWQHLTRRGAASAGRGNRAPTQRSQPSRKSSGVSD